MSADFNVPSFDRMGHIIGGTHRCGGSEELIEAVRKSEQRMYETCWS
jgi:metal-dependent hydrolase (beta-lactamase superfamily II)